MGTRKNFFKIYRQFAYAPTKTFASPDLYYHYNDISHFYIYKNNIRCLMSIRCLIHLNKRAEIKNQRYRGMFVVLNHEIRYYDMDFTCVFNLNTKNLIN